MNPSSPDSPANTLRATAARWTVRRDRGLSAAESIEYELWLAADPRHAAAMQRSAGAWARLDRLPERAAAPVLASVTRRRSFWRRTVALSSLAAAAALAVGLFVWFSPTTPDQPAPVAFAADNGPRTVALSDGSLVQLNTGSEVREQFTASERRVLLARGEAHFSVTKNPARPFIVRAGALDIRAVGTAFNINLQAATVDVVVTEGRVQLAPGIPAPGPDHLANHPAALAAIPALAPAPALDAGERAVLPNTPAPPTDLVRALTISRVDAAEMTRTLSWREPLLRLGGATLAELAVEFERATRRRLVLADPALAELRFGGRFRADDIDGFTHLLATTLDLDVESAADGTIVLRKKNPNSP